MLIVSLQDLSFQGLAAAWRDGSSAGTFWRQNTVHIVRVTSSFVIVSDGTEPQRLAIKPTKNIDEAHEFAKRLLSKEQSRGHRVEFS